MGNTQPIAELTHPQGSKQKDNLEILFYTHLGVAISKIIIMGFHFGFGDLIQCLILWCGYTQHNFCNVFIYMLACLMLAGQIILGAGFAVQTGKPLD